MGRGDRKTTKGKIAIRSYGNPRPHVGKPAGARKSVTARKTTGAAAPAAVKKAPVKKAPVKKAATKAPAKKAD
jgi:ribosomal small subunit protein bTHX